MEKSKEYKVYELCNTVNGKKYIGVTSIKLSYRHGKNGVNYKINTFLWKDIEEFGWDKFCDKVLTSFDNRNDAEECAKDIINKNNYKNSLYGYNSNGCNDIAQKLREETVSEHRKDSLELCKKEVLDFYNLNGRFPTYREVNTENGFSYSYANMIEVFKKNNIVYQDWLAEIDCFALNTPNVKYYDKYVERLIYIINNEDSNLGNNLSKLSQGSYCKQYKLPSYIWFIKNCPDESVINIETLRNYIGLSPKMLTKEQCEEAILKMAKESDRPLMYDDFRGGDNKRALINMIRAYWGSMNKMKEALGLEIIQPQMIKITKEDFEHDIEYIQNYLKVNKRDFISSYEINSIADTYGYNSLNRYAKENLNISLHDYLQSIGICTGESGTGIKTVFDDGEVTMSQFEYMFSSRIRELGLKFDVNYKRNVKYSTFCKDYDGNMDCDYVININNKTIYVEIAGIIEYYKRYYFEDKVIENSKSKENYRKKLKEKEQLLRDNNCLYFILFPCDLTESNIDEILHNPTDLLRKQINKFIQNNVDWVKVRNNGKLDYDDPTIIRNTVAWKKDNEKQVS